MHETLEPAYFYLGGYVNKQNCRIWGSENPKIVIGKPLHPQHITDWCVFWAGDIIGPYFLGNQAGAAISVNGLRCRTTINKNNIII